jgi:uncharacterized OsmC-like protein
MPKTIASKYLGKFKSSTESPNNNEPIIAAGATSFTPVDLLVAAYGSCLLGTVDYAAQQSSFETIDSRSEINFEMSADKTRIGRMTITLFFGKDYTDQQKAVIEHSARYNCHVGNSLYADINREYAFVYNTGK